MASLVDDAALDLASVHPKVHDPLTRNQTVVLPNPGSANWIAGLALAIHKELSSQSSIELGLKSTPR